MVGLSLAHHLPVKRPRSRFLLQSKTRYADASKERLSALVGCWEAKTERINFYTRKKQSAGSNTKLSASSPPKKTAPAGFFASAASLRKDPEKGGQISINESSFDAIDEIFEAWQSLAAAVCGLGFLVGWSCFQTRENHHLQVFPFSSFTKTPGKNTPFKHVAYLTIHLGDGKAKVTQEKPPKLREKTFKTMGFYGFTLQAPKKNQQENPQLTSFLKTKTYR